MASSHHAPTPPAAPRKHRLFRPKLLDSLKGYQRTQLGADIGAGIAVGLVALPLAMAFAIASGLGPQAGLFTAIIAGFLISALGGSRVQIGGPAGAFIVIVYGIVHRYGVANLVIATAMSGVLLLAMGFFRLGTLIRFIPVAVIIGFTNGIAVLIALSQIKEFLGLQVQGAVPADFFGLLRTLWQALPTWNFLSAWVAMVCLVGLVCWQFVLPRVAARWPVLAPLQRLPGSVIMLLSSTAWVAFIGWDVETIGSRFGGIPSSLPGWQWPEFSWGTVRFLFVPALTLALLGAIESLLCARVADSMIDDRHDPNQELMAQGVANLVTPFFGGMPATGTIARTMTNIRNGATSPVAGMVHAVTLLAIVLLAAPLAAHIPLSAMAAILMFVAWNMGEWREFLHLRQYRMPYRLTLLSVFVLTVIVDLTAAVEVGLVAACLTFIYRISSLSRADPVGAADYPALAGQEHSIHGYRLHGALFFGAVKLLEDMADHLPQRVLVLDFKNVLYVDSSGADSLADLLRACGKHQVALVICGLAYQPLDILQRCGIAQSMDPDNLCATMPQAIGRALAILSHPTTVDDGAPSHVQ
ncbi:SulP family inorganic anion transporter [Curvibacter sp. APW13]|uniref:SulP family inorganic anion transporter n=1 Tax=Curvibacter sp. APW13 TaxID=3077236 RepID=UPI0028DE4F47|nr:SulP family inorganic anion transporter [Curvibacter sp. APW13]MDT8989471.1 SulP family inorganic anion transporter [Curvibacter sp. APW13]